MSLLQNEEFVLYQLRTAYLSCIKDGVGERLINVNTSVLNNPAFRAAGWVPSAADIKRTYSPPIPTAVASEYFQAPRSAGLPGTSFGDDDDEGGMVTGGGGSNDTVGPALNTKRRRRKEQLGEDDSSDLSDESDDDFEAAQRAAQQIRFNKMPVRTRAGSSPLRSSNLKDGPALLVTSPSRPPESNQLRRGSLGAVEAFKQRARRDTTTSSEMSSENELDPSLFKRKQVNPQRAAQASHLLSQRIQEDERENETFPLEADPGAESDDSTLSSEFAGTADSESLLGRAHRDVADSSLPLRGAPIPPAMSPQKTSPKKSRPAPATLQALPPPRPISVIQPVSALTLALKAKDRKPVDPFERFATLSGKGDPNPLYIRVYAPFSTKPTKPYEMLVLRATIGGAKVTVAEAIGLALYRYGEEKSEPAIEGTQKNVNRWNFRMIEDDEVDYDFPALTRNRPFTDFTSNNNRGTRGRSREKPWDEFALVEASEKEFRENEALTPEYSKEAAAIQENAQTDTAAPVQPEPISRPPPPPGPSVSFHNPITGPSFAPTAPRKDGTNLLDAPAPQTSHATPRTGAPRTLTVRFMNDDFVTRTTKIEATTDTYIAEVFSQACKVLGVDPAMFVLKVSGTNTVAPSDRTVEALGDRLTLDFQRRRFVGDGVIGIAGSPGSSSPNAPLLISSGGTPKKGKKGPAALLHPLAQKQDLFVALNTASYKRYAVTRKQPMSFSSSSSRILALDGEYMHIMPAENHPNTTNKIFEAPAKTTTVPFSSIVGSKVSRRHPRMFRVVVFKERETKRYDFEASSQAEAAEIVREIKKGVERFNEGVV
ncbi:hypothetical protein W97_03664 [Coniosporium apollinis CBS 100218]|uniref:Uncharacterized protein n=1 Tax=Coniosporium apollinis (strain CBS 100218) TaxID=1168221 RepID=R7YRE8_CONA1|nr:uncharacterized protein W97_03664 [Coniosporium apollinis CBS 100218]EON64433.1 hypothetical protein W97_03664 [Coniosporium apollinis CBS 100218]